MHLLSVIFAISLFQFGFVFQSRKMRRRRWLIVAILLGILRRGESPVLSRDLKMSMPSLVILPKWSSWVKIIDEGLLDGPQGPTDCQGVFIMFTSLEGLGYSELGFGHYCH